MNINTKRLRYLAQNTEITIAICKLTYSVSPSMTELKPMGKKFRNKFWSTERQIESLKTPLAVGDYLFITKDYTLKLI